MSFSPFAAAVGEQFGLVLRSFLQPTGLAFAQALSAAEIAAAFAKAGVNVDSSGEDEDVVYTPAVTLWAFLSQVLHAGTQRACLAAVSRVAVWWGAAQRVIDSTNTGAYCRARAKLPEPALRQLTCDLARDCEQRVRDEWRWKGRRVWLLDGTTLTAADTLQNQAEYPQQPQQAPGLGFPILRCVGLLSLATGLLADFACGPYCGKETGEPALFRQIWDCLQPGDVLLADRAYCSYFLIGLCLARGIAVVFRLHQAREADFRRGRRLGPGDHLVTWSRPDRPDWMTPAEYAQIPLTLTVRELSVTVHEAGFRTRSLVVVTSLLEAETYPHVDLAELYHRRWLIELDWRSIKVLLGMDQLRCQSPEMLRREIWICLLAYNLIRQTMLAAALTHDCSPRTLSFAAALQFLAAAWMSAATQPDHLPQLCQLHQLHQQHLRCHPIGNRPNRLEPRAVKRRPKPHDLLTKPRAQACAELLALHAS